ncbi:MAG TPA: 30S ribosome-binding factor RbfA [Nitrosopumilaceae archaeon]|jgi:ribosome-binding factor A|nr:30S ribosome-binding factor RbfA [Nitrosopumilaceae archaeon]
MESLRQSKVAKLLQKELAELFRSRAREMFDGAFITVTIVRISPDLSVARVYLSIMASKDKAVTLKLVQSQSVLIRKHIGAIVKKQLRIVPTFTYFIDDSLDYAEKIDKLLKK